MQYRSRSNEFNSDVLALSSSCLCPGLTRRFLSFRFSDYNLICIFHMSYACYKISSYNYLWFYHRNKEIVLRCYKRLREIYSIDTVRSVYHFVIYIYSPTRYTMWSQWISFNQHLGFSSTCFGPHRSIIRSVTAGRVE